MIDEAYLICRDIENAIMVGAVGVMLQTKRSRTSHDVDIALPTNISRDTLLDLGYIPVEGKRDSWYSPRGIKVDMYRKDVSGIPISEIIKTATTIKRPKQIIIKVASLEVLIITKHRLHITADRPNDVIDIQAIVQTCRAKIDWAQLEKLCTDNFEYKEIKKMLENIERLG